MSKDGDFLHYASLPRATARLLWLWQDIDMRLGYFEEYSDYLTQGESLTELEENLRDLYQDLTSGQISGILKFAELSIG